jgi:DNA polymerase sigma
MVGSALNGFSSRESDLDLCVMLNERAACEHIGDDRVCEICLSTMSALQKRHAAGVAISVLESLTNALSNTSDNITDVRLIRARVPILRFFMNADLVTPPLQVDINVNNVVTIYNTHLLWYYSMCKCCEWCARIMIICMHADDPRVRPFVQCVKSWARAHGVADSLHARLSSYSLVLMCINYLQVQCPPVLPSLQALHPWVRVGASCGCQHPDVLANCGRAHAPIL